MLFGCPRQNVNHGSENLKVIYIKCSMFCAIINCQFKTSELKRVEKLVKQKRLGMYIFVESAVKLSLSRWFLKGP